VVKPVKFQTDPLQHLISPGISMGGGLTAGHCFGVVVAAVMLASVVGGEAGAAAADAWEGTSYITPNVPQI
jgi:hypothetical protein